MEYLVTFGATIVGGSLALAGVFLSNRSNRKLLEKQIEQTESTNKKARHREAGEELFEQFSKWACFVTSSQMTLYPVMQGKLHYDSYLDSVIENKDTTGINHHRIEFLIQSYFPSLLTSHEEVQTALNRLNKVIADHKRAFNSGEDGTAYLTPFTQAQLNFSKKSDELKNAIVRETTQYL